MTSRYSRSFEEAISAAVRTLTIIVIILATFLGLSLAVATYAIVSGSQALDRVTAVATAQGQDARQAAALASVVAAQRTQTILRLCREQNTRHTHTLAVLDRLLAKAERVSPPLRRAQLRESRSSTILLIDQLAPLQNCQQQLAASRRTH